MESVHKLRIFAEVYRTLNVTKAAENLYMTQPAVSRAIHELEEEYGIRLFERYHHRLIPAESAHMLYKRSVHILDSIDELNTVFAEKKEIPLRIGSSITIGNILLPQIIHNFSSQYPEVQPEVMIANGSTLQKMLLNNDLDLALIEDSVHEEDLRTEAFRHDELLLILPPDHPLTKVPEVSLKELLNYPFLMRERGSAGREYLEHLFAFHGLQIQPLWQSTSTQALIHAVAEGIGISVLPRMLCQNAIENGTVVTRPVKENAMKRTYYVVTHKEKFMTAELQAFRSLCLNTADPE